MSKKESQVQRKEVSKATQSHTDRIPKLPTQPRSDHSLPAYLVVSGDTGGGRVPGSQKGTLAFPGLTVGMPFTTSLAPTCWREVWWLRIYLASLPHCDM